MQTIPGRLCVLDKLPEPGRVIEGQLLCSSGRHFPFLLLLHKQLGFRCILSTLDTCFQLLNTPVHAGDIPPGASHQQDVSEQRPGQSSEGVEVCPDPRRRQFLGVFPLCFTASLQLTAV